MAFCKEQVPMPNNCWWVLMETSYDIIKEIASVILDIYNEKKMNMKELRDLLY